MRTGIVVEVSAADRTRLKAIVADRNSPQKHVWRAEIVLLTEDGLGTTEIMRRTGKAKAAVWRWQERFMQAGVDGLLRDKTRPSRIPPLPAEIAERAMALTVAESQGKTKRLTAAGVASAVGISASSVRRIWRSHGLQPHRIPRAKLSNDLQHAAKRRGIAQLHIDPPAHAAVRLVDEKSRIQALDRAQPGLPLREGRCGATTRCPDATAAATRRGHQALDSSLYAAGFAASPFRPDDIGDLQGSVGLPLAADADVARLADELGSCIRRALDRVVVRKYAPPPSEIRDLFGSLRRASRKLIAELGLPRDPGRIAKLSTADVLQLPTFRRLLSAALASRASAGRAGPVAMAEVAAARLHPAEPVEGHLALLRTLAAVPAMFGMLLSVAEDGWSEAAEGQARRGARPDDFRRVLFANLAGFHHRMFGRAPEIERNRGERDGSAMEWARAILRIAQDRIPDVLVLPSADPAIVEEVVAAEMEAIKDAAELAHDTLADRLREGVALWRGGAFAAPE